MIRELVSKDKWAEAVKFEWNDPRLEIDEVHIYRFKLNDGSDGYYYDNIMRRKDARRFWESLLKLGYTLKPLPPPPSYED